MSLLPFFKYYGAKWRAAPRYPAPVHQTVVEPFAGAAGYSLRHPEKDVVLVDAYPVITGIWRYLVAASPEEILALPDVLPGQTVDDIDAPQAAKWLIGFWLNAGSAVPCKRPSKWMLSGANPTAYWGDYARQRIARQVPAIRHWKVVDGSYADLGIPGAATWFVDPPYEQAGAHYKKRFSEYEELAKWCRSRTGQVIVCENEGATWLPFSPLFSAHSTPGKNRKRKHATEVMWHQPHTGAGS